MDYPNVSLEGVKKAAPYGANPIAVESATETLREIMGEQFPASQIRWDATTGSNFGVLYSLSIRIPDWNVNHCWAIPALEIIDNFARPYRMRSIWGELLRDYSHRLLKEHLRKGAEDAR
jgi:hypothetical protein